MIETIRLFLWTHPWWHAAIVIVTPLALAAFLGWREIHHSKVANKLREDANTLRTEANRLRDELKTAVARIADNTKRVPTQAEKNAIKLRNCLRKTVEVSEGNSRWGAGAEIVEVSEDDILTLFTPAGYSSSSAFAVHVQCDQLQIVEVPVGGCALQIKVLERYGATIQLGDIRRWEDRKIPATAHRPRGKNVFHSTYHLEGSSNRRGIYIYAPTEGNPQYTLVTVADNKETCALYGDHIDISKRFAIVQIEWLAEGFQRDAGGSGGSPDRLFVFTSWDSIISKIDGSSVC